MDGVVERALEQAGLASAAEVDAVAVTVSVGCRAILCVCALCFSGGGVASAITVFYMTREAKWVVGTAAFAAVVIDVGDTVVSVFFASVYSELS